MQMENISNKQYSIKRLNGRHILVHFIAAWPFIYASRLLAYFYDIRLFKILMQGNFKDMVGELQREKITAAEVVGYSSFVNTAWWWGLLVAFFISLWMARRWHGWWINSLIATILVCFVRYLYIFLQSRIHPGGWYSIIYKYPMQTSIRSFIVVALLCVGAGCVLFFSKRINAFIAAQRRD